MGTKPSDILKQIKEKEIEWIDLRFTDGDDTRLDLGGMDALGDGIGHAPRVARTRMKGDECSRHGRCPPWPGP